MTEEIKHLSMKAVKAEAKKKYYSDLRESLITKRKEAEVGEDEGVYMDLDDQISECYTKQHDAGCEAAEVNALIKFLETQSLQPS